jgi:protoheme IX farnesyltransferase
MMPLGSLKDKKAAFQINLFTWLLVPACFLPVLLGCAHLVTCTLMAICSVAFGLQSQKLFKTLSNVDAKRMMFASIMYLPVTLIILLIEKIY